MAYKYDPEVEIALAPRIEMRKHVAPIPVHDVEARRNMYGMVFGMLNEAVPTPNDVNKMTFHTKTRDGHELEMTWITKTGSTSTTPGPAIVHIHGGGMILASVTQYNFITTNLVSSSGVPLLSVEYRYAPEHPHPTPVEDCFTALSWLRDNASTMEPAVDPNRIGIFGDSGGGGIAAGLALYARDQKFTPPIAKQILIYPMLDHRNTVDREEMLPWITWSYQDNLTGWAALLGKDKVNNDDVSPYASAARVKDVGGLPPTYIDVGELDIFRDEDVDYAKLLMEAGVSCELHVHPGCPHAWEMFARDADVSRRAREDRLRALRSF